MPVRVQTGHRQWVGGTVKNMTPFPRSYEVQLTDGRVFRRNSSQLKNTKASFPVEVNRNLSWSFSGNENTSPAEGLQFDERDSSDTTPQALVVPDSRPVTVTRSGREWKAILERYTAHRNKSLMQETFESDIDRDLATLIH
uniref:Uncharacterized protein n=1 Tax=Strigamia maritima TaxID=126957 RepID=T1IU02_STRMM